jgi:hypothetical protein
MSRLPDRGQISLLWADFEVRDVGSLVILDPLNDRAESWAVDNLEEAVMRWDGVFVVEPRHLSRIIDGLLHDGFTVSPMPV